MKQKNNNLQKEINWLLKEKYNGELTTKAKKDIHRLKVGEPLDYVIGFTEFLGCKIDLSHKPLIPRPETAFWTQKAINQIMRKYDDRVFCAGKNKLKILDMFAGSGCVGLAVAKSLLPVPPKPAGEGGCDNIQNFKIVFTDNDKSAILQIKKNIKINRHIRTNMGYTNSSRCVVIRSDIFGGLKNKNFNFILANPPYIPAKNRKRVEKSALLHEPSTALFGGANGLFYIKKFLKRAKNYLTENGTIYMEFDGTILQKKQIEKMLQKFGYSSWQFHKDQFKRWRWVEIHFTGILNKSKME